MKSKININGHPLHPILVGFPIAFFSGTLLFDVLAIFYTGRHFDYVAYYLVEIGLVSAVVTAIPGLVDYIFTVPPKSSAKSRAATHGILNTINLLLFFIAWILKRGVTPNTALIIGLEAAGFIFLCFAGWMGGTLVYRNQIGVDIRYADAGQWKEQKVNTVKDGEVMVASKNELKTGQMKLVHHANKRIVIANTETGYVAFDDACTHKGGSLAAGSLICGVVQCPWHGSQFDTVSGACKAGPATKKITVYEIIERHGRIFLKI